MNIGRRSRGRLADVEEHPYVGATYGGRLVDDRDEAQPQGTMLFPADRALVDWASYHWPEADPADYEWDLGRRGLEVRHRDSDTMFRISLGHPYPGTEKQSDVRLWCVRDGRLILLSQPPVSIPAPPRTAAYIEREIQPGQPLPSGTDDSLRIW
jgi:hypothetical protein